MKRVTRVLLGAVAMVGLVVGVAQADPQKAEVFHWWTSGGEAAAVQEFAKAFNAAGGEWVDTAIGGSGSTARPIGINRIIGGDPPAAMQFNTGKQIDELVAQGLIRNLDDIAEKEGWKAALPPAFYEAVTRDGHVIAVPVNNHGQNWVWYNKAVLEKAGIAEPTTWDEFFAAGDKLKAAGIIPVAVGGQPWQLNLMLNAILLSEGGKDLYLKVYKDLDPEAVKSPEFKKVAEIFGKLRDYSDPGNPNRDWNVATGMVISGKAGFQFMGDWAKGEFVLANQVAGKDFGCILGPGQKNFIMGGDVFIFPKLKDEAGTKAQDLLATVMMSKDAQVAFNAKKGSVPVRLDVDNSALDACAKIGVEVLQDPDKQIPAADILASADVVQSLTDVVAEYWANPSMTADAFIEKWNTAVDQAK
ncbi:ABC transporter substrate-binding protein [Kaistia granuli]|uniref:ABC transporter substrate-binding protein n=1 Tax=Kaistia granuli TaxID=363259 RepID=UPI0004769653|nr:ABC transporter substrate-binding protein [Kaistia granuli]